MVASEGGARAYGARVGSMSPGVCNTIADVQGVKVGHVTKCDGPVQTGITAIKPHGGRMFQDKLAAACHVINGFGKSVGLLQIQELGTLETPILLTNTLSVPEATAGLLEYMLDEEPDIGLGSGTVNAVVTECNDGYLNAIRSRALTAADARQALKHCAADFAQGTVGAGRGMSTFGFSGGIGSASRVFFVAGDSYTLGSLVLTNFGRPGDLRFAGVPIPLPKSAAAGAADDNGSVIIVLATDLACSSRQLQRIARRAVVGLARTGSFIGHGSGDIVLAFSTAASRSHSGDAAFYTVAQVRETYLDQAFQAAAEVVEEAVLNALCFGETVTGRDGHKRPALSEQRQVIAEKLQKFHYIG